MTPGNRSREPMHLAGQARRATPVLTAKAPVPVLIVDDSASKRLALKAVLSPLGYLIVEADSGTAALRCVMARDFAVILLDVCMPDMDGFETAALIRQRRQSEMTPIIFITAFSSDDILTSDLYAEGAVDFIFAPVPPAELRAKVSVFANLFLRAEELAARAREVQGSADQLRMLTDSAPIGIFQTDAENRYIYTNPRWSEITGMAPDEAAGRKWDVILGSHDRASLATEITDGRPDDTEFCRRFQVDGPGGRSSVVLITSRPMPGGDGGGIAGWVGTIADVTAEAGAEAAMAAARDEATEASRLKSDFLANMSHEIRTPMNAIIGMTDLLLETGLDTGQRDYAQTVRNSSEALLAILNDILDFSRIEAGRLLIEDIEFSVHDTVGDVVDLLAGPAQAKGLELTAIVEQSVPAVIVGDPGRVRQVLTNLIGNAIKFTHAGEVVVRVTATEFDSAGAVLRFEISDTGDGIAADKIDIVFQPFVQADTSTSRKYGGTGLGLSISGQLVALMGGDCGVSSTLGAGSEFWFTVRVRTEAGGSDNGAPAPDADLVGVTALVVDDSAAQRRLLSGYLTGWGMHVSTASSGAEGLAAMRAAAGDDRPFAVVLLDRFMPGMDGLELKDAIVADPELSSRLVLVTGLGRDGRHDSTDRSGLSATLSKPVHPENLQECLRIALGLGPAWNAPLETGDRSRSATAPPKRGRLLLAEDNVINQKVAVAMLSSAGYVVDVVDDGGGAVQAVAARRYDAILMDCQMPGLNGYDATVAIRAQEGTGRRTPIIALTASARREDRDRCLAAGMDSYLAKPVSKDALVALVASWARRELSVAGPGPDAAEAL
ncbi:MAG TPA: response regulator [Acidimicrobiales bacterium]|nr:response regulator [Acidimicrobiales bacterium]